MATVLDAPPLSVTGVGSDIATTRIMVVTGDNTIFDTIEALLSAIEPWKDALPELALFIRHPTLERMTNVEMAKEAIEAGPPADVIVLDSFVLQSKVRAPRNGRAAIEMLDWLDDMKREEIREEVRPENMKYAIPVLVVATESLEAVERKVLGRERASLWHLGGAMRGTTASFARALAGLATQSTNAQRRITIMVERASARYYVGNGRFDFLTSGNIPYSDRLGLENIITEIEKFAPDADNNWFNNARRQGQDLFNVLIRDTVGPHLVRLLQNPHAGTVKVSLPTGTVQHVPTASPLDMRFDIVDEPIDCARLFQLPFEFVNDRDFDGVLCSHIPMARRVRLERDPIDAATKLPVGPVLNYPLHILFMDSDVHGVVSLPLDTVRGRTASQRFAPLKAPADELKLLMNLKAKLGNDTIAALDVIGRKDQGLAGAALKRELMAKLREGNYDIFHFCGHSVTACDGLTHLLLHDEGDKPMPVSIRDIARWMSEGQCKLLVLSSCEGASVISAIETMRLGAYGMIGFRWVVRDDTCLDYFRHFYQFFLEGRLTLSESYQRACDQLRRDSQSEATWASAVAVLRD